MTLYIEGCRTCPKGESYRLQLEKLASPDFVIGTRGCTGLCHYNPSAERANGMCYTQYGFAFFSNVPSPNNDVLQPEGPAHLIELALEKLRKKE